MSMGFMGLFAGGVILSIGYKLFETWLNHGEEINGLENRRETNKVNAGAGQIFLNSKTGTEVNN